MAVQGLDADNDGVYSKEELEPLAKINVESLKEFAYFTFVHLSDDDKSLPLRLVPAIVALTVIWHSHDGALAA